jgi:hypothetical protein
MDKGLRWMSMSFRLQDMSVAADAKAGIFIQPEQHLLIRSIAVSAATRTLAYYLDSFWRREDSPQPLVAGVGMPLPSSTWYGMRP